MPTTRSASSYSSFAATITRSAASYSTFSLKVTRGTVASYDSNGMKVTRSAAAYRSFHLQKRVVYARNQETDVLTELGTLLEGQTVLTDVSLADGFYNIEVRSSLNYWDETRSRVVFPVEIASGVILVLDIPNIVDLSFIYLTTFQPRITWSIPDGTFIDGLTFGIWLSATTPVDVSGPPDLEVSAIENFGTYQKNLTITADMYVAVAAFTDTDQGSESEVFIPWSLVPPDSPPDQYAYRQ